VAVALDEPVWHRVDDVQALAVEPAVPLLQDLIGELAEEAGQVTAGIPLQPAALGLPSA
jgi:hypothetical protein